MSDDPVERSDELDRAILVIPRDRVFTKRAVTIGFAVVAVIIIAFSAAVFMISRSQVHILEQQVNERDKTIATLRQTIRDLGGEPPSDNSVSIKPFTTLT